MATVNYNNQKNIHIMLSKAGKPEGGPKTSEITATTSITDTANTIPTAAVANKISNDANKSSQQTTSNSTTTMVEGVPIEGYETLTAKQKQNLHEQLKDYQNKIKASIKDGSFDKFIEMAFGRKVDNPAELAALKKAALSGDWEKVIPKIKMGSQADFNTATSGGKKVDAMGAFIKGSEENGGTGTIILNTALLDGPITRNGQTISFQNILTEEIGHSWDVKLNKNDSKGDEGEALSILFNLATNQRDNFLKALNTMQKQGTNVDTYLAADKSISKDLKIALKAYEDAKAQNDSGKMTITNADGTKSEIDVEFGWLKKAFNKVKKGIKSVVKAATKVFTMPLRIMGDILPEGNLFEKATDTIDDAVDDALEFAEKLADKAFEVADKAWKKFEKEVLQSKWLGPVLMIMSFIPVLGTVAMVAQLALAAYQVGKGLETGNMAMVMGGVMSAVGGATAGGLITGATATTIATAAKTGYAAYNGYQAAKRGDWAAAAGAAVSIAATTGGIDPGTASNITQGINVVDAIENKDYVGAFTSGIALAGNTKYIEKDTAENIQKAVEFGQAIDNGDAAAAIRLGTNYAGTTDWAKANPESLNALETGSNIFSVIEDDDMTEEEKAEAISKTLYDQELISEKTYNTLNKGAEVYEIVKGDKTDAEKVAAVSDYLLEQKIIDEKLNDNINTGANIYAVVKSDKTDAEKATEVSEYLHDADFIGDDTYDTVQTGLGAYNIAKGDGNSAEITQQLNDYLFEKDVIDFDTHSTINTAANTFDNSKSDNEKAEAYFELLEKLNVIDPETQKKLNEYVSVSEGNSDEIIAKLTSDESTLLDSETKQRVKDSYNLYTQGEQAYNTVTNGSTPEQVKLFTESAVNSGAMTQEKADELYAYYESGKSTYDIVTNGSTEERVDLLIDSGLMNKDLAKELYAYYDTVTDGSTSERVKLLIDSGVIDQATAKELYAYYETGKNTYDIATNGIAA